MTMYVGKLFDNLLDVFVIAPEIFATHLNKAKGYSYEVDWWSVGISVCEMIRGKVCIQFKPYILPSTTFSLLFV